MPLHADNGDIDVFAYVVRSAVEYAYASPPRQRRHHRVFAYLARSAVEEAFASPRRQRRLEDLSCGAATCGPPCYDGLDGVTNGGRSILFVSTVCSNVGCGKTFAYFNYDAECDVLIANSAYANVRDVGGGVLVVPRGLPPRLRRLQLR